MEVRTTFLVKYIERNTKRKKEGKHQLYALDLIHQKKSGHLLNQKRMLNSSACAIV